MLFQRSLPFRLVLLHRQITGSLHYSGGYSAWVQTGLPRPVRILRTLRSIEHVSWSVMNATRHALKAILTRSFPAELRHREH